MNAVTAQDERDRERRRAWLLEEARHHRALANHYRRTATRALDQGNPRLHLVATHAAECQTTMHTLRAAQAAAITDKEHTTA